MTYDPEWPERLTLADGHADEIVGFMQDDDPWEEAMPGYYIRIDAAQSITEQAIRDALTDANVSTDEVVARVKAALSGDLR